jgi:hypothetical protein
MKISIPFAIFLIFVTPFEGSAEDVIKKGESLNMERCIEIALNLNPA